MPALCTGILGFAYQYTWFFAKGNELTTLYYTVGEAFAVSLILLVVMMPDARPFSLTRAFRYLCPLTCLALVISVLAQGLPQGLSLSVGIASAAFNLSLILLIPLCADLGRKRSVSIPGLYAASACAVNLFPTLGYICGLYLEKLSAPWTLSIGIACVVVQVAIIYLGRNKNDVEFDLTISEAKAFYEYAKEQKGEIVFGRDYACRIIADEYGLSHRETEVLGMALQGKDAPGISDALGISRNTVRTHLQRIFQKTGLHSRQELVRLSENIEAGIRAAGEKDT